ncbi:uncharacterized protein V1516DRAFT_624961 [Lipomyces oligophaga]|uniref:uncharacterized protein n=1 Tax=Lipomyces oligophaga TaxID=45792 RepID=UPI0034CF347E
MQSSFIFTGQQEHYLKKELINLELSKEVRALLEEPDALKRFGSPFRADNSRKVAPKKIGAPVSGMAAARAAGRRLRLFGGGSSPKLDDEAEKVDDPQVTEISIQDSEFPFLRFVFVNYVRNFPFINQNKETEFWQDKVQTFWESFSEKKISTSDDRTEETKRMRIAYKIQKMIEVMMSSGIRTASGIEKGVGMIDPEQTQAAQGERSSSMSAAEKSDTDQREKYMIENATDGRPINGFDINVVGVRNVVQNKRRVRGGTHLEFIIRTTHEGREQYVSKRYSDFKSLYQQLLHAFPERSIPRVPMKNKLSGTVTDESESHSAPASTFDITQEYDDNYEAVYTRKSSGELVDDAISVHSSQSHGNSDHSSLASTGSPNVASQPQFMRNMLSKRSITSMKEISESTPVLSSPIPNLGSPSASPRSSSSTFNHISPVVPEEKHTIRLIGEQQRLSLRAFLRNLITISAIAESEIMRDFLCNHEFSSTELTPDEKLDIKRRADADALRLEEQYKFLQIASQRARDFDVYMAEFKRDLIQRDGLSRFFGEIREKERIADLSPQYQKFVEWARIEVAATIYHLFVGQDNASEMLAQTKRIHRLIPYGLLKNVMRFSNPVSMMKAVLDLFLAQPFGQKSLLQRILYIALNEDIKVQDRAIAVVRKKLNDDLLCDRIQKYVDGSQDIRSQIHWEEKDEEIDIIVAIAKSDAISSPPVDDITVGKVINSWIAWNLAVEDISVEVGEDIRYFSNLKSLLKLMIRKRDKDLILALTTERVTLELFKDVFTMFYEPLVKVYKSANVHHSVTDVADFVNDLIKTVEHCHSDAVNPDANVLVQKFVDLCERHQEAFYRFVHDVHIHDNGLFSKLMTWIETILEFLRDGPGTSIDMNELFHIAISRGIAGPDGVVHVSEGNLLKEIDCLIEWTKLRKQWRENKLRDRLKAESGPHGLTPAGDSESDSDEAVDEAEWRATLPQLLRGEDFGLRDDDLEQLAADQSDSSDEEIEDDEDQLDPIEYERRARARRNRRNGKNGEPPKPELIEIPKLLELFVSRIRVILS